MLPHWVGGLHSLSGGVGWALLFKELRAETLIVGCSQTFLPSILPVRQDDQSSSNSSQFHILTGSELSLYTSDAKVLGLILWKAPLLETHCTCEGVCRSVSTGLESTSVLLACWGSQDPCPYQSHAEWGYLTSWGHLVLSQ